MVTKKKDTFQIVPFSPAYERDLLELERMTAQGFLIKMEMSRPHFLSRAETFEKHAAYVVLQEGTKPVACGIGAEVPLCLEGNLHRAGFGFDVLVNPAFRNLGIGKTITQHVTNQFFNPQKLAPQFTTTKINNLPTLQLLSRSYRNTHLYEFLYLSFPTAKTIRVDSNNIDDTRFKVDLLSSHDKLTDYYETTESGLGLWKTHKFYQLRVKSVNPVLSGGMLLGSRLIRINKYVPVVGSILKTVTVFNLTSSNVNTLPEVSLQLYKEGINYIQICCQPSDPVYRALHKSAINAFSYYLVSTQEFDAHKRITVDVRCL
ncbi:GNAT family N-acetyltransferase [Pontibacter sp. JH31]|uniref:GNAT family N-acetyltransferase n=1 Tax=Pontibacter aquaedesilientis TaxID=2766980 RepID=A0ABR7XDQ3_9BACT|nr:GNAT family N-acetyltransferase [Pontibacter aquaedesilientis]MBD1396423.1 GNAT family N-acetyltransferase [Pontibacter aquaedesilientis]